MSSNMTGLQVMLANKVDISLIRLKETQYLNYEFKNNKRIKLHSYRVVFEYSTIWLDRTEKNMII